MLVRVSGGTMSAKTGELQADAGQLMLRPMTARVIAYHGKRSDAAFWGRPLNSRMDRGRPEATEVCAMRILPELGKSCELMSPRMPPSRSPRDCPTAKIALIRLACQSVNPSS